jgi:acyl-CoA thioester hydrolase
MKLEVPTRKSLLHTMTVPIRWGDMDCMGHVNNTVYFRYMETARIQMLEGAGFTTHPSGQGFVIANIFCNFIRQLEYPGEVLIKSYDEQTVYASGGETIVWLDFPKQKSLPMPDALRQWLSSTPLE